MKNGFLMLHEKRELIEMLTDEEAGQMLKMLYRYTMGESVEDSDNRMVNMAYHVLCTAIDAVEKKYQEKCEKARESIRCRWEKKASNPDGDTNVYERIQTYTNEYKSDTNVYETIRNDTIPIPIPIPKPIPTPKPLHSSECITHTHEEGFASWLGDNCPYIAKHMTLPTANELEKLTSAYGMELVQEMCQQIENRTDLRKRYTNLYRTLLNWLKRETKNNSNYEQIERINGYAEVAAQFLATPNG